MKSSRNASKSFSTLIMVVPGARCAADYARRVPLLLSRHRAVAPAGWGPPVQGGVQARLRPPLSIRAVVLDYEPDASLLAARIRLRDSRRTRSLGPRHRSATVLCLAASRREQAILCKKLSAFRPPLPRRPGEYPT